MPKVLRVVSKKGTASLGPDEVQDWSFRQWVGFSFMRFCQLSCSWCAGLYFRAFGRIQRILLGVIVKGKVRWESGLQF